MSERAYERGASLLILLGYLILGTAFAVRTPAWQAPDEPAHYNYVAQLASGTLPVIHMGDWDQAYLDTLKAHRFSPELTEDLARIQYEDHQPPLYYALLTPVYWLTDGSLAALRLASVAIGAVTVLLTFVIGRALFPAPAALAAMALVAFLPQHVAIMASVNNDALAGAVVAAVLWQCLRVLRGTGGPWLLGLLMGVAFITKATTYLMAAPALLAIGLRWQQGAKPERGRLLRWLGAFALPAGAFALAWWGRNLVVYGFPDFLGLRAHDAVVVGQLRTTELVAQVGAAEYLHRAATTTFQSFWGMFGWMAAPLQPPILYLLLLALTLFALLGVLFPLRTAGSQEAHRGAWLLMGLVGLLTLAQFLYYNATFVQFQGRYLFPALIPFALVLARGLAGWQGRLPGRLFTWTYRWQPLVFLPLALLSLWMLQRYIVPGLSP